MDDYRLETASPATKHTCLIKPNTPFKPGARSSPLPAFLFQLTINIEEAGADVGVDVEEDEVDYEYDAAALARTGGLVRGGRRHRGKNSDGHAPTKSMDSDDSIAQQEQVHFTCVRTEGGREGEGVGCVERRGVPSCSVALRLCGQRPGGWEPKKGR